MSDGSEAALTVQTTNTGKKGKVRKKVGSTGEPLSMLKAPSFSTHVLTGVSCSPVRYRVSLFYDANDPCTVFPVDVPKHPSNLSEGLTF